MKNKPQKQNYRNAISRFIGYIANISRPRFFVKLLIKIFVLRNKINLDNFEIPHSYYKNFNAFFTRRYKSNLIRLGNGIVSPVDGYLLDYGKLTSEKLIKVKEKDYDFYALTGEDLCTVNSYAVFYLAPHNYHRVHAPFDIKIKEIKYLPGTLRSVRTKIIDKKERVYCRNERIVLSGDSIYGKFHMILVGALVVGKVKLSFESGLKTNIRKGIASSKIYDHETLIKKGDETGLFEMGSSVVLFLENEYLAELCLEKGSELIYGVSIRE